MRRPVATALVAVALTLLAGMPALAQTLQSGTTIDQVETSGYPEVLVLVTAPPTLASANLEASDWILFEDSAKVDIDEAIWVAGDRIKVALVIDTSGSMAGEPLSQAVAAANGFLDALPPEAEVALVGFGTAAEVLADFTTDLDGVRDALDSLTATGETALYDGIVEAADLYPDDDARRSLIVLTDGEDTVSTATEGQAAIAITGLDGSFYAVELETGAAGTEPLTALAAAADGTVVGASGEELALVYADIASRISSQYVLRYTSSGSGPVTLGVRLAAEGDAAPVVFPVRMPIRGNVATTTEPEPTTTSTAPPPPTTMAGATPDVPWAAGREMIWVGIGSVFVGLAILLAFLLRPGEARERQGVRPSFRTTRQQMLSSVTRGLVGAADKAVERRPSWGLDLQLEQAGIRLRPGEFVVLLGAAVVLSLAIGALGLGSVLIGLALALGVGVGGILLLSTLRNRRHRRFENLLPDVLEMLASTIRTGYAPLQATELVTRETAQPAKEELGRVVAEARLGRDYIDAMGAAAQRTGSRDMQWVVEAMEINRDVGGDVSELLDNVANTIRERVALRRMISALSAEGRLSAWILIALPFLLALFINSSNPGYLAPLFNTFIGIAMVVGAVVAMIIGVIVIRRIVNLEP